MFTTFILNDYASESLTLASCKILSMLNAKRTSKYQSTKMTIRFCFVCFISHSMKFFVQAFMNW